MACNLDFVQSLVPHFSYLCKKRFAMTILDNPISRTELKAYAANTFGDMIKCVADVDKRLRS